MDEGQKYSTNGSIESPAKGVVLKNHLNVSAGLSPQKR